MSRRRNDEWLLLNAMEGKKRAEKETQTKQRTQRTQDYYVSTSLLNDLDESLCQNESCVYSLKNYGQEDFQ